MNIGNVIAQHEIAKEDALPGYRFWYAKVESGLATLESVHMLVSSWPKYEALRAVCRCLNYECRLTQPEHTCGIYALMYPQPHLYSQFDFVFGEVRLWGEVFVHEFGLRGMFAEPVCLWSPGVESVVNQLRLELVAEQYGLPIVKQPEASETYWVQQDWRRLRDMSRVTA